jgi:hypothetical protein
MARYRAESLNSLASRPVVYAAWVGVLLMLALTAVSCDEGSDIKYVNMTEKTIEVYIDDLLVHTLEPYETRQAAILKFSLPKLFEAREENGTVVFSETLTWEDLEAREFRLVFTDPMPP